MLERFTDRARSVLQLAKQEAERLDLDYVGPEHILIGLLKHDGPIAHLLSEEGVSLRTVRDYFKE